MKTIPLTKGKFALVDDADYPELSKHKWYASKRRDGNYVATRGYWDGKKRHIIYMHRQIMKAPKGTLVDHHNHNGLDNQRHNLRVCSTPENSRNMLNRRLNKTSKYKGVTYIKSSQKWRAFITFNYKGIHIGCFDSEIEAAKAYDKKARKLFGEFAHTNF